MILVTTVKCSGTNSLIAHINEPFKRLHCCEAAVKEAPYIRTVTPYRDPMRVAATWHNRDIWDDNVWMYQWACYHQIIKCAEVFDVETLDYKLNSVEDRLGLHQALDDGDLDYFHSVIPEKYIDYAKGEEVIVKPKPIARHYNIFVKRCKSKL